MSYNRFDDVDVVDLYHVESFHTFNTRSKMKKQMTAMHSVVRATAISHICIVNIKQTRIILMRI